MKLRTLLAVAAIVFSGQAVAIPITLTLTGPIQGNTVGPQSTSNPCIIAATQCQQPAGFPFNNFVSSGAISSYNESMAYTVSQFPFTTFDIAIDVNTAAGGETLQSFTVTIGGVLAYQYTGPTLIGNVANNGNGFADFTLSSVSLAGLAGNTSVVFNAVWNNASDGGESFFLVNGGGGPPNQVPEPMTVALVGLGLFALAFIRRQRRA